ncbi:hypothetical protein HA402_014232 [Bradysia odoriphaga]|nr:hypothetical protein HA402_014232 [Bradysia odoriphaga]
MTPSPVKSERKSNHARPDNKLIVSNMKSVINSVKLHKKHKKRKRKLDETPEIHDISNILQSNLSFISPSRAEAEQSHVEIAKVTTIPEMKPVDSSMIALEDSSKENSSVDENTVETPVQSTETKSQSTSNAFEFMMTARYKSIGTNSPGRELTNKEIKTLDGDREANVKRKLMLEEWADRKGRAKKRQVEAADDEYIDMVMDKRAKRLRTLLKNGKKQKSTDEVVVPTKTTNELKSVPAKPLNGLKLTKGKNRIEDSEDDDLDESHKSSTKSNRTPNGKRKGTTPIPHETFIEKLSSPVKKRDSLFGYFSKLTKTPSVDGSPTVSENGSLAAASADSKSRIKKRGRPKKTLPADEAAVATQVTNDPDTLRRDTTPVVNVMDEVSVIEDSLHKPSSSSISETSKKLSEGRPKRLCRDKKISYLIDEDYTPVRSREKKVVDKEHVTPKAAAKQSKPTKLAPIFAKAVPKPFIDPTVIRARHEFLMSGIPEKMKLEIEKQRQFEELYETEYEVFPKISHVGFHTDPSSVDIDLSKFNIRFRPVVAEEADTHLRHANILKIKQCRENAEPNGNASTTDQKDLVRQLKQNDETEFPYYRCFKQLRRKNAIDPTVEETDCDNSIEFVVDKVPAANGNELFTEKYRSLTSSDVLLNTKPLNELQKFLSSWKENMDGRECANSSDEFDTNSNSGMSSMNKAIVLTGPSGCGKTMFVYALADEMNFKVLEINAGAKRSGKKVLKKLQEATQSHHVNNNQCSQGDRGRNTKSKYSQSEDSEDVSASQKLSLILIEDAEVVFEEDIGFVESINQLVTTTKRPVILITNQINCPHLSRFINRNMISFAVPRSTIASKWLATLSIAEQCYVPEDMCRTLYQRNNYDFRKTLLELQFFIQSTNRTQLGNAAMHTNTKLRELFFNDQNQSERIVPFPIDFATLNKTNRIWSQRNADETNGSGSTKVNSDSLSDMTDYLNNISMAQWLEQKTDSSDRVVNHLNDDISHFLVEQSIKISTPNHPNYVEATSGSDPMRPQQLASNITSRNLHSTRAFNVDIEPCLRSICRSELLRSHKERRSSRFYHYLRSANTDSFGTKVLDDHCLIFSSE